MEFMDVLPRLAAAHDQGVLVPFLGAGMSRPTCPGWGELISGLETRAGVAAAEAPDDPTDLVRRGNRAVRILKRRAAQELPRALRAVLYAGGVRVPPQTAALAAIWWPLVLTTNYDDLLFRAYKEAHGDARNTPTILGRSPDDCQRVLNALSFTGGSVLWALQGYLGKKLTGGSTQLEAELVVGHEEYRRVAHTSQHFRRAFAEVFRRRSLLFLGSSLGDSYLLDLFGEILEFSGANPLPHYAIIEKGTADVRFLRSRFNIIALEYGSHDHLPVWLTRLRDEIHGERVRPQRWTFGATSRATGHAGPSEDLALVRGPLARPGPGECAAVSAGTGGDLIWLSAPMAEYVGGVWPSDGQRSGRGFDVPKLSENYVRGHLKPDGSGPIPIVAVVARDDDDDRRDLRIISDAATELFEWAAGQGYEVLRMPLLASGKSTHFPPRFSLAETVRAFGRWRRGSESRMRLVIHLVDPSTLFELVTGRLDVVELLTCDDVRFWVEVVDGTRVVERELVFAPAERTLGEIGADFELPADQWAYEVIPRPRPDSRPAPLDASSGEDLLAIGVISGATLRFLSLRAAPGE